jgi:hypothetical protein
MVLLEFYHALYEVLMNTRSIYQRICQLLLFITWFGLATESLADTAVLLTTITNPSPASENFFGYAVASFGADRMIITAPSNGDYPGAAYLFTTNGVLVQTFLNPTALPEEGFATSVTGLGNDRLVINAPYYDWGAGAVYVFHTNGTLLTALTNTPPRLDAGFGTAVAAFGTNTVLIGACEGATWRISLGSAYLVDDSGNLINVFTNPTPVLVTNGWFGYALAAVGTDRVLIGAWGNTVAGRPYAGAAYLFHNGSLLTTLPNPTPAPYDHFGIEVAAIGTDRVIITAPYDDTGATNAGSAYIFSTNGSLLLTLTNPAPTSGKSFGHTVAVSADHRLLIGAYNGAVYVYSTNGELLATIANPNLIGNDAFGSSVAWVGNDRVLVGASDSDIGGVDRGVAYLFGIIPSPPSLGIRRTTTNTIAVSWPSPSTGWTLQQNTDGIITANWSNITSGIFDDGTARTFVVSPPSGTHFFRLVNP